MKDNSEEEKKENISIFDAFSQMMSDIFVMDPSADGEKTHITSVEIRDMLREVLDISVNDITLMMMKLGYRVTIIGDTACWNLIKRSF